LQKIALKKKLTIVFCYRGSQRPNSFFNFSNSSSTFISLIRRLFSSAEDSYELVRRWGGASLPAIDDGLGCCCVLGEDVEERIESVRNEDDDEDDEEEEYGDSRRGGGGGGGGGDDEVLAPPKLEEGPVPPLAPLAPGDALELADVRLLALRRAPPLLPLPEDDPNPSFIQESLSPPPKSLDEPSPVDDDGVDVDGDGACAAVLAVDLPPPPAYESFAPSLISSLYRVWSDSNRFRAFFRYPSTTTFRAFNSATFSSNSICSMYRDVILASAFVVRISSSMLVAFA
jgi:hypothetical protein